MQVTEGTIYPLLKRLKDQGSINSYIVESQEGPPRKYYEITPGGTAAKREQEHQWREFSASINKILKDGDINE
jgi:PadR family transcriptional regulator PadR